MNKKMIALSVILLAATSSLVKAAITVVNRTGRPAEVVFIPRGGGKALAKATLKPGETKPFNIGPNIMYKIQWGVKIGSDKKTWRSPILWLAPTPWKVTADSFTLYKGKYDAHSSSLLFRKVVGASAKTIT